MGKKKKVDVSQEEFVTSTADVVAELAADTAIEEATDAATAEEEAEEGTEEGMAVVGDDAGDDAAVPAGNGEVTSPFTSDGNQGPYVTREPDKVSASFTRELPVPVPDEELAEHAKEMARLWELWKKTKLDAKKFAKACKGVIDETEEKLVTLAGIIEEGTEDRPTPCRWEFNYAEGTKKLRRLDNFQIVDEETLQGDELHMSFNFDGSSERAVEELREAQAGSTEDEPMTYAEADAEVMAEQIIAGLAVQAHPCDGCQTDGCDDCPDKPGIIAEVEPATEQKEELTLPSGHPCKICGFDAGSHIYLVRHLRDVHVMSLAAYKSGYPVVAEDADEMF